MSKVRRLRGARLFVGGLVLMLAAAAAGVGLAAPPAVARQEPLEMQWWFSAWAIQERLWPVTRGAGQVVAVIDSGVQADLPDLAPVVRPGKDYVGSGDGRTDYDGHGTGMAALIAAQGTGTGMLGIAPEVDIIPIALEHTAHHAPAIRDAVDLGATVINMSIGAENISCLPEVQAAVSYAIENDVVIVAAAGNDGDGLNFTSMPANCPGVFAIGAVDHQGVPAEYTQRHDYVDAAGPGTDIRNLDRGGGLTRHSIGTSNAAALVSGAVALLRAAKPELTNREVVDLLIATSRDVGVPGKDEQSGWGVVRPHMAINGEEVRGDTRNTVFDSFDEWASENQGLVAGADPIDPTPPLVAGPQGGSDVDDDSLALGLALVGGGLLCLLAAVGGGIVLAVVLSRRRNHAPTMRY